MAESKVFESGGFVVTTERFVYGSNVVPLEDISQATPFVEHDWKVTFIFAGIGLAMLIWGGGGVKVIGLLLLVGAFFFFRWATDRNLVLNVNGEYLHIKVSTTDLLYSLSGALNKDIQDRRNSRVGALRDELASLPRA